MELFSWQKAREISGVTIFKALKFGLIFLAIAGICYSVYVTIIKPHTSKRMATTKQEADEISNINHHYKVGWNFGCARFPIRRDGGKP